MLSRVADNLYWMSRYLERAEHTARLLDVQLEMMSDRASHAMPDSWGKLFKSIHIEQDSDTPTEAYYITQALIFDTESTNSVISYIAAARENARQIREMLSSEMWEQLNSLYLEARRTRLDDIWQEQPYQFFHAIKDGVHLFRGITNSTMNRGEGWHFIQLGQAIERVSNTAAILDAYFSTTSTTQQHIPLTEEYLDWVCLLRSCTALEAYSKVYTADLQFDRISEFLLLNQDFPHAVHFGVIQMQDALSGIADATQTRKTSHIYRLIGRLRAMLSYDEVDEIVANGLGRYMHNIQRQCGAIHQATYQTYITYPIEDKLSV